MVGWLGFTPLPLSSLLVIVGIVRAYLIAAEFAKRRFYQPEAFVIHLPDSLRRITQILRYPNHDSFFTNPSIAALTDTPDTNDTNGCVFLWGKRIARHR